MDDSTALMLLGEPSVGSGTISKGMLRELTDAKDSEAAGLLP